MRSHIQTLRYFFFFRRRSFTNHFSVYVLFFRLASNATPFHEWFFYRRFFFPALFAKRQVRNENPRRKLRYRSKWSTMKSRRKYKTHISSCVISKYFICQCLYTLVCRFHKPCIKKKSYKKTFPHQIRSRYTYLSNIYSKTTLCVQIIIHIFKCLIGIKLI